jgi:hypothetical protein
LSDAVIENLIREIGVDRIWAVMDKLTQSSPSLAAFVSEGANK